jgi:hypothetical protein
VKIEVLAATVTGMKTGPLLALSRTHALMAEWADIIFEGDGDCVPVGWGGSQMLRG